MFSKDVLLQKMLSAKHYMSYCVQLAQMGRTLTNPRVGCIIVYQNAIIGEGYHQEFGKAHAERNAFNAVKPEDKHLIKDSDVYITLEPCTFYGKTPACTDLFKQFPCKRVFIGLKDVNPKVAGKGIQKLKNLGIEVILGVEKEQCAQLIRPFTHGMKNKKPYTIAKWAESFDGFIALPNKRTAITNDLINLKTQVWRSQFDAYLIGKKTLEIDEPKLNSRVLEEQQPLRVILGNHINLNNSFFNLNLKTVLCGQNKSSEKYITRIPSSDILKILETLYKEYNIGSLVVEGGSYTIQQFLDKNQVQEIRRIINPKLKLNEGVNAPQFSKFNLVKSETYRGEIIEYWQK